MIKADLLKKEILEADTSEELEKMVCGMMDIFIDAIKNQMLNEFNKEISHIKNISEALRNYLDFEGDVEKEKIYYFASLETILYMSEHLCVNEVFDIKEISAYKYMKEILRSLYENGPLPQCNLAERIGIEHHNLSNMMRRTDKFQLWSKKKRGNYNYYHLTKKGKDVYCSLVESQIKKEPDTLEEFLLFSLETIESESPYVNNIVTEINHHYGCNIIKSENMKIQLQNHVEKRNPWIESRKMKERNRLVNQFFNNDSEILGEYYDYEIERMWE